MVERLSEREKEEIVRLSAMGLPSRLIGQQIGRHHRTVWGHLQKLRRPTPPEPITPKLTVLIADWVVPVVLNSRRSMDVLVLVVPFTLRTTKSPAV